MKTISEHKCFGGVQGYYSQASKGWRSNSPPDQLYPEIFEAACRDAGQPLTLRRQEGYDHGYFFISTFMEDHLRRHAAHLTPSLSPR